MNVSDKGNTSEPNSVESRKLSKNSDKSDTELDFS